MLERANDFGGLTVSIGVASMRPRLDLDAAALVKEADAALYRAKAHGRNRVESNTSVVAVPAASTFRIIDGSLQ